MARVATGAITTTVGAALVSTVAVAALWGSAAAATTAHVQSHHRLSGTVTSVNGTSAPGTCGSAGVAGNFAMASKSTRDTVDVGSTSTTFAEKGVGAPSFADVCTGDTVHATGTISANGIVTAIEVSVVPPSPQNVSGAVTSVNGTSAPGTCGVAGAAGNFAVASKSTRYTVDVGSTSTTFAERGVEAPSFADVCTGDTAHATGTISADVVTATEVLVVLPPPQNVSGTVTSVNDMSAPGTCGVAGAAGNFAVASKTTRQTVDVGSTSTTFAERGVEAPSFADVCTGDAVRAVGTAVGTAVAGDALTASRVRVIPPRSHPVTGTVTAVDGTSVAGTCGSAGAAGDFTLASKSTSYRVDVGSTSTTFKEKGNGSPSFAAVCTGDKVRAAGTFSADTVSASQVTVIPPRPRKVSGTVVSVDGTSTCGVGGAAGDFTLASGATRYTVDVGRTSTTFKEHGVTSPSFAAVCPGDKVQTIGTVSNNNDITATAVLVTPPPR